MGKRLINTLLTLVGFPLTGGEWVDLLLDCSIIFSPKTKLMKIKHYFFTLLPLCLAPSPMASSLATFQWTETDHDFGKIQKGKPVTASFEFTNTGRNRLSSVRPPAPVAVPGWSTPNRLFYLSKPVHQSYLQRRGLGTIRQVRDGRVQRRSRIGGAAHQGEVIE